MNTRIVVTVEGEQVVVRGLHAFEAAFQERTLRKAGNYLVRAAHNRVDKGIDVKGHVLRPSKRALAQGGQTLRDSGEMMDAYQILDVTGGRRAKAVVGFGSVWEHKKAIWAQFGTKPHTIRAKKKGKRGRKVLAWKTQGGDWRYAASVKHPGTPKRPVFGFGIMDEANIGAVIVEAIEAALRQAKGAAK